MTTATARPLSARQHPVSNAAPRTRRAAQPGLPVGQAPQASTPASDLLGRVWGYLGRLLAATTPVDLHRIAHESGSVFSQATVQEGRA